LRIATMLAAWVTMESRTFIKTPNYSCSLPRVLAKRH
jgi:hypothetical protein